MRTAVKLTAIAMIWLVNPANGTRIGSPAAARVASTAQAQTPDAVDVAEGMRLYLRKGDCQTCHGWAADGRKMDSQMPDSPNLRETRLNRDRLILTIKCGRPGTGMPAFDKFAYSDGRCYGMKQADLKSRMPDPPATFQQREIELVADFLMLKVVGKGPMDRAKCIEYWGSDVDACRDFPK
jgi:Cytochrome C oxidase, cbb3-type, subunit III